MKIVPWKEFLELCGAREIPEDLGRFDGETTERQKERLRRLGIGYDRLNRHKADIVICVAEARARKHLATPGQLQMLRKLGRSNVRDITFDDARRIIGDSFHW